MKFIRKSISRAGHGLRRQVLGPVVAAAGTLWSKARRWVPFITPFAFVLLGLVLFLSTRPHVAEIPYSTFIEQLRAHNVREIMLDGERVHGSFHQPIAWPPDAPSASYQRFTTIAPPANLDTSLFALLEEQKVTVFIAESRVSWYLFALMWGLPLLILLGTLWVVYRRRRATEAALRQPGQAGAIPRLEATLSLSLPAEFEAVRPEQSLADVVGHEDAKRELSALVALLRAEAAGLDRSGRCPRGELLIGLPGVGKTLLARAVAGEAGAHFLAIKIPEWLELHHEGGDMLHRLFEAARQHAPTVLYIDGIDILRATRPRGEDLIEPYADRQWLLRELAAEMDSLTAQPPVFVLAGATSLRHVNPVLLRPRRFGQQISLSLPTWTDRLEILRRRMREINLAEDVDMQAVARRTVGLSGADLAALGRRAIWLAQREGRTMVGQKDLLEALNQIVLGRETSSQLLGPQEQRIIAVHEAGHALLSRLLGEFPPQGRLSVLPGNDWSSLNEYILATPHRLATKATLLARLTVMLGGRCAEEIALGDVSTASESDLEQATRLARRMAARWGMSELGPISFPLAEVPGAYGLEFTDSYQCSESSAGQVDRAVRVLLEDRHAVARHILKANRPLLDHLVNLLLREETIHGELLVRLMEKVSSAASLEEPRPKR